MKILSDISDPSCVVTNAEVREFLEEKRLHEKIVLPNDGRYIDRGSAPVLAKRLWSYLKASPAGDQTVDSVAHLRVLLEQFQLSNDEFVQIVNLRADNDTVLEAVLSSDTAQRLTDDEWNQMRGLINDTLEERPTDDVEEADDHTVPETATGMDIDGHEGQ